MVRRTATHVALLWCAIAVTTVACQQATVVETPSQYRGNRYIAQQHTIDISILHGKTFTELYWQDDDPDDDFTPFPLVIYRSTDRGCNLALIDECADGKKYVVVFANELPLVDNIGSTPEKPVYYWAATQQANEKLSRLLNEQQARIVQGRDLPPLKDSTGAILPVSVTASDYPSWRFGIAHPQQAFLNKFWIIGGVPRNGAHGPRNDVWSSDDGITWKQLLPHDPNATDRFSPRAFYNIAVFQGRLWLFGGHDYRPDSAPIYFRNYYNDVWSTADGIHWRQEVAHSDAALLDPVGNNRLPSRSFGQVVSYKGSLFYYGGIDPLSGLFLTEGTRYLQDQYSFFYIYGDTSTEKDIWRSEDGKTWQRVVEEVTTPGFVRVDRPAFVEFNNYLWMIGGGTRQITQDGRNPLENENDLRPAAMTNAVWRSSDGIHWENMLPDVQFLASSEIGRFSPRARMPAVSFNGRMWLFGGDQRMETDRRPNAIFYLDMFYRRKNDVWSSTDGVNWRNDVERDGYLTEALIAVSLYKNKYQYDACEAVRWDAWTVPGNEGEDFDPGVEYCPVTDPKAHGKPYGFPLISEHHIYQKDGKLWMMGGLTSHETRFTGQKYANDHATHNAMFVSSDAIRWERVKRGLPVADQAGLTFFRIGDKMYLYGGTPYGKAEQPGQPLLLSSTDGFTWQQEQTPPIYNQDGTVHDQGMQVRYHPTVLQDPDHRWVIISAGIIHDWNSTDPAIGRTMGDAWMFNGQQWKQIKEYEPAWFVELSGSGGMVEYWYWAGAAGLRIPYLQRFNAASVWYREAGAENSSLVAGIFGGTSEDSDYAEAGKNDFWRIASDNADQNNIWDYTDTPVWQMRVGTIYERRYDWPGKKITTTTVPFDEIPQRGEATMFALPRPQMFYHPIPGNLDANALTQNSYDLVWIVGGRQFYYPEEQLLQSKNFFRGNYPLYETFIYFNDTAYFDPSLVSWYDQLLFDTGQNPYLSPLGYMEVKPNDMTPHNLSPSSPAYDDFAQQETLAQKIARRYNYPPRGLYQSVVKEDPQTGQPRAYIFGGVGSVATMQPIHYATGKRPMFMDRDRVMFMETGNDLWSFSGQPEPGYSNAGLDPSDPAYYRLTDDAWRWRKEADGLFGEVGDGGQVGFGLVKYDEAGANAKWKYWYLTDDEVKRLWVSNDLIDWSWFDYLTINVITDVEVTEVVY